MRGRLTWLAVLVVAVATITGISLAVIGISEAFSPPVAPLPASLTLMGPPPAEASPSVDLEVVPSPSIDLTEEDSDHDPGDDDADADAPGDVDDDPADNDVDYDSPDDDMEDDIPDDDAEDDALDN